MPNICEFEMFVNSDTQEELKKFIEVVLAKYDYNSPEICNADYHLSRVWVGESSISIKGNTAIIVGDCAWSVFSCMFEGTWAYYNDIVKSYAVNKVTSIPRISKLLNLRIEIISIESGLLFIEHYVVDKGDVLLDDSENYYGAYEDAYKRLRNTLWFEE